MSKNPNYTNKTKNTATNFDLITEFLLSKQKKKKTKKKKKNRSISMPLKIEISYD